MIHVIKHIIFLLPICSLAQVKDINIHVALSGIADNTKFYLFRAINLDSTVSKNGQFDLTYHKSSLDPEATAITTGYKEPAIICWVENEDMTIAANYANLYDTKSTGSATQKEFEKLIVMIKPDQLELKGLRREVRYQKDSIKKALARIQLDSLQIVYKTKIENFIIANPKSSVSTFILMASVNEVFTKEEVMVLYSKLDKSQQESESGKSIIEVLEMFDKIKSQK